MNYYSHTRNTNFIKVETHITPQTFDWLTFLAIAKGKPIAALIKKAVERYVRDEMEEEMK
ncbi:hypothetical protein EI372_15425 [Vibrio fluvialis]|jgi:hypothetical protein|nr:hypothetical protein [Vibrio fluvialis]